MANAEGAMRKRNGAANFIFGLTQPLTRPYLADVRTDIILGIVRCERRGRGQRQSQSAGKRCRALWRWRNADATAGRRTCKACSRRADGLAAAFARWTDRVHARLRHRRTVAAALDRRTQH